MAARYWVTGGNGNTNSTTNWSTSNGGASGASVPTLTDDAIWNENSGSGTVVVNATLSVLSANFTNFTGTLSGSSTIQIYSGGITLYSGMTITHTGSLNSSASATWTSNGKQWNGNVGFGNAITTTFADNWDILGNFIQTGGTSTLIGNTITVRGNFVVNAFGVSSTTNFILAGTGSFSVLADSGQSDYTFNTAGTITFAAATFGLSGSNKNFTYIAGTIITTGSTLSFTGSGTLDLDGISFNNLNITGPGTYTLLSDLDINGNSVIGSLGQTITINGLFNMRIGGNLALGGSTSIITGTTSIIMDGTGTLSSTQSSGTLRLNLTFNTSGTITISNNINYRTGTITYISGTIITTNSTLSIVSSTTINTFGMIWNNLIITGSTLITLDSQLTYSGNMTLSTSDVIFGGTSAFFGGNLIMSSTTLTASRSLTLVSGLTYTIVNMTMLGSTDTFRYTIKSSTPSSQAILTCTGQNNVMYVNATDIDSSMGKTIFSFNGVLNNTLNWELLTPSIMTSGGNFVFHN